MKRFITSVFATMLLLAVSANATPLYTKCAACHGEKGEKVSLGKSLIIKDMDKDAKIDLFLKTNFRKIPRVKCGGFFIFALNFAE